MHRRSAPVPPAGSWFICFWEAEIKMSQTAPSSIWVFSVPEESKVNTSSTSGSIISLQVFSSSVSVSCMDAAAKICSVQGSTSNTMPSSSSTCGLQAVMAKSIVSASKKHKNFFICFSPSPKAHCSGAAQFVAAPVRISMPWVSAGVTASRFSRTAFGLPGRLIMRVRLRMAAVPRDSMPRGVIRIE